MSNSLRPHGLQHTSPSPTPGVYSNSCPLNRWCHPTVSSSVVPFSSCLQSFSASGSLPMSRFFASGGQSTGVSASTPVLPMNIQDWFPLGWTSWISLQSKGLSRVFSNTHSSESGTHQTLILLRNGDQGDQEVVVGLHRAGMSLELPRFAYLLHWCPYKDINYPGPL